MEGLDKELEKIEKYQVLKEEVGRIWGMRNEESQSDICGNWCTRSNLR